MEANKDLDGVRILVVEDEPFQQRMLRDVLKSMGFRRTMNAESGAAAISLFEDEQFDVILSDIEMPGLNGLELLRHIRTGQTRAPRDMRFIVLTSHSDTDVISAAMALDVNGFIVKPFKAGVVLDKIARAVSEQMILRSDGDYSSVVTDLESLRSTRDEARGHRTDTGAAASDAPSERIEIPYAELHPGMRVAKDLVATDGTVIVAAETILTEVFIKLLSDLKELLADGIVTVYRAGVESTDHR